MSISGAMNLVEYAKTLTSEEDQKKRAVVEMFAAESDIMRAIGFRTISGNAYKYNVEAELPGVAFRGLNESFTPNTGVINPQVESLFTAGGELDVDTAIVRQLGAARRSQDEQMKVKALAASFTDKFLKGDNTSDKKEFDGLQTRLTGSQYINNASGSGGAAPSLAKLDELIDSVNGPTHLIMNRTLKRRLIAAARTTTITGFVLTNDKDEMGKPVMRYNDLPILTGYEPDSHTGILPFTEAHAGGGTSNGTSIYCVSFTEEKLFAIQSAPISVKDLGECESSPVWRTRVEWDLGLVIEHQYGAARLDSITDAAWTA